MNQTMQRTLKFFVFGLLTLANLRIWAVNLQGCAGLSPEPGTHLKIPANHQDFTVISIVRVEELRAL